MATSSRPKRQTTQRCLEYNGGLLHEEELAIRRALQASLNSSRHRSETLTTTSKHDKNSSNSPDSTRSTIKDHLQNNNNNNLANSKATNTKRKKTKQNSIREDETPESSTTPTKSTKKQKLLKDGKRTRSRSSSLNSSMTTDSSHSSTVKNPTSKHSITNSSTGSQTSVSSPKMKDVSQKKLHKKDKIAIRVRKKLLKEKIWRAGKVASNGSDCESTKSSSTVSENVTSKKTKRGRKRKCPTPFVQKKFASITPSSSSIHPSSSLEVGTPGSLEKAEDFIDFLCLRGHPFMPKELEVFSNNNTLEPSDVTPSDDETPPSPPSSLLSELPSSPASSNPIQNSLDSSCETPVCETPLNSEDDVAIGGMHALRMYAGIENRPKTNNSNEEKGELTIAEVDSEEEANRIPKSVTPPLSFRVSPRSAPPLSDSNAPNLSPSPGPLMATSRHLNLPSTSGMNHANIGIDLYPTPDGSAFGSPLPPPLLLSPNKSSLSSNNCCSPPPLLYIPAAAQRVTHLHGPPKLERVETSRMEKVHRDNRDSPPVLVKQKPSDFTIESRFVRKESRENTAPSNRDANPAEISHLPADRGRSPGELPCSENTLPRPSSTGGIRMKKSISSALNSPPEDDGTSLGNNLRTFQPYTRDSRSCPLHSSATERPGEAKRTNDSSQPKSRDPRSSTSGSKNQGFCPLHSSKQSINETSPAKKISVIDLSNIDSPDCSVSLEGTSLLDKLQKVHDGNKSISPARDGTLSGGQNESEHILDQRDSRVQGSSSIGSISPSPNIQIYKSPLNSNLVATPASPGIKQDRLSPCLRRPRPTSATNSLHCSLDKTRTSPFAPVRDMITPTLTPPASGHFVGQFGVPPPHLTQTAPPFECGMQDALSPPWSHLQPSYSITNTPPRPYTLSINSQSASPVNTNHCCSSHRQYSTPRAIPVLPPTHLPAFQQGTLVHFNGEYRSSHELGGVNFGQNLMANQNYNLPRAFENTSSPRKAQPCSDLGKYDSLKNRNSGGGGLSDKSDADNLSSHVLNPSGQNVSVDLTVDDTNAIISQPPQNKVTSTPRDQHVDTEVTCDPHTGSEESHKSRGRKSGDVTNPSDESSVKKSVDTEIKKRRGRPPGSKNKKTMAKNIEKEANSKKDSPSKGETPKNVEETETVNPKVVKTKKVESPILRPTDEEFKDPIKYLKSVQATLKKFGICIIDPPESWKLESHLPGNPRFTTKRQLIHRLQKRWGPTEIKLACIEKHIQQQQSSFHFTQMPVVGGCDLDLPEVSRVVNELGGMQKVIDTKKWNKVADLLRIPKSTQDRVGKLQDAYCKYLLSFDLLPESEKEALEKQVKQEIQETESKEDTDQEKCYLKGRSFSMGCFQRTARSFQDHFFKSDPSVNDVEREYWKIVQSRERYVAAHHIKLDTQQHGSCFPTSKTDPYTKSGWNLNVLPVLKGSLLRHAGQVEDLTIPWLNIDMLFSTKRWTTTPLQTYLIDYLHSSTDKVWYGVPESDMEKFPYTKKDRTNDFEDGEAMVSPSHMTRESDIIVTRLVQKQGQFVVIAPKVFYCNISCGYSVSETVAFAFPDWILKTPSLNTELFAEWPRFSFEKVLLKLADEVTDSDTEILERIQQELKRVRDGEVSSRKKLKGLGVTEGSCTNTTSKGVQTIKTKSGCIQVHSTAMYCGQCNRLCHLSAVLNEDSELLCLSDAVDYIREENCSDSLSIVTNCSVTQIDEVIESFRNKLNHEQNKKKQQ